MTVSSVATTFRTGLHEVSFTPPCIVTIVWNGDVSDEEARAVATWYVPYSGRASSIWATDLSRLGKMSSAASSSLGAMPPAPVPSRRIRCGYAGANLRTKITVQFTQALARYTTGDELSAHFFDTMEQLQAWARREAARITS